MLSLLFVTVNNAICTETGVIKTNTTSLSIMTRLLFASLLATTCSRFSTSRAFSSSSSSSLLRQQQLLHQGLTKRSFLTQAVVSISDAFDGGNIEYLDQTTATATDEGATTTVRLNIKKDPYTELEETYHFQYFSFRSLCNSNDGTQPVVRYVIENAGDASYAKAWEESTVFFSRSLNDPFAWKRIVDTEYKDGALSWTQTGSGYFAYFPPYSYNRHLEMIERCGDKAFSLGKTLDGRDIDCVKVGSGDKICWIIHRQHPGETMAEFFAEGLLERLLLEGEVDGLTARVLQQYTFYIVPNMCLDGSVRGHLRTNAHGQNLNREWAPSEGYDAPTLERSPEVYHVLRKMDETGVDAFFDIHGDEVLPFNFLAGSEGMTNWGPRLKGLHGAFLAAYERSNSDMQKIHGYAPEPPKEGRINVCSNQVGLRFDCLAATLEMPFKDCLTNPNPSIGWSPARAKKLGASILDPLSYIYPYLRDTSEFWNTLPEADNYVLPTPDYKS